MIWRYQMTLEINSHICLIILRGSSRWRDAEQMEAIRKPSNSWNKRETSCQRAAVTFQHVGSGKTRAAPQGGLMLAPLLNLSFLFITKAGSTGFCHADGCLFYCSILRSGWQLNVKKPTWMVKEFLENNKRISVFSLMLPQQPLLYLHDCFMYMRC